MTRLIAKGSAGKKGSKGGLEAQLRDRIASLSYLPTTAAVAMKFVELGKDFEADPADYAKVIRADSSLSSKMLALANSSWAGVRNKVTNVTVAVNLLGLGTVRTLAVSYCMTGLHNELRLTPEESAMFWEASLCKAVAAKRFAAGFENRLSDEALVAGLFQDFGVTIMYATARERFLKVLRDRALDISGQLRAERALFGMDHAQAGRMVAEKLDLPDLFIHAVAHHHDHERLVEFVAGPGLAHAIYAASFFPHLLNKWHKGDAEALRAFLSEYSPQMTESTYLLDVQREFDQVYAYFHEGKTPQTQLQGLFERACREMADRTTELVGAVNQLLNQAATAGMQVDALMKHQAELEDRSVLDPLTGVLNRAGFMTRAEEVMAGARRRKVGVVVVYLDVDRFKSVNDNYGHQFGDFALQAVAAGIRQVMPPGAVVGRMGGDEFVFLLIGYDDADALRLTQKLLSGVADSAIPHQGESVRITLSAGLLLAGPGQTEGSLDDFIRVADELMYRAKRNGGNRVESSGVEGS